MKNNLQKANICNKLINNKKAEALTLREIITILFIVGVLLIIYLVLTKISGMLYK